MVASGGAVCARRAFVRAWRRRRRWWWRWRVRAAGTFLMSDSSGFSTTAFPSRYSCAFVWGCSYRKSTRVSLFLRRQQPTVGWWPVEEEVEREVAAGEVEVEVEVEVEEVEVEVEVEVVVAVGAGGRAGGTFLSSHPVAT